MSKLNQTLELVMSWLVILALALAPVFFLPFTQNFYDSAKWVLLVGLALAVAGVWAMRLTFTGKLSLSLTPATASFALLAVAALLSLVVSSNNKIEAILAFFGAGTFGALTMIFLLAESAFTRRGRQILRQLIVAVAALAGLVAIWQYFGLSKTLLPGLPYLADSLWTPLGSSLTLTLFFLIVLPLAIEDLWQALNQSKLLALAGAFLVSALIIAGLSLTLSLLVPIWSRIFLPLPAAWAITLEVLKNPRAAFLGVGAENFTSAFTQGRPLYLNTSPVWNVLFATSSSSLLHLTTIWGLIGAVCTGFFLVHLWRTGKLSEVVSGKRPLNSLSLSLGIAVAAIIFAPPSLTLILTVAALLLVAGNESDKHFFSWQIGSNFDWLRWSLGLAILATVAGAGYGLGRAYTAELVFFRSLIAAQAGDGQKTYNYHGRAISLNPQIAHYHISYSQISLAVANAIARNSPATESAQISETSRQTIANLIQQAIREAKLAINLAPSRASAWENLANIYQVLIPTAQGASGWTIASFQRAIQLDPTNPVLRLNLGGVYVGQNNYDAARDQFLAAASLKPDYTNAYYNLANSFKLKGDSEQAIAALEKTLTLVTVGTSDYTRVQNELEALKQSLPPASATPSAETTLTKPSPGEPLVVPPLSLPEESGPQP